MDISSMRYRGNQNFSEFLDHSNDIGNIKKNYQVLGDFDQFANDRLDKSDISAIMRQKFVKTQYPADLMTANIYCPVCGKLVKQKQQFSMYQSQAYKRRFLAHDGCLSGETLHNLNDLFVSVQQMPFIADTKPKPKIQTITIGERQFCVQINICHPLSELKLIKRVTKSKYTGSFLRLQICNREQIEEDTSFQPNTICFPYVDFKIVLKISEIGTQEQTKIIKQFINLSRTKLNNNKCIHAKAEQTSIQLNVYTTQQQKLQLISNMNFKYRLSLLQNMPIVQINSIQIEFPQEQFQQSYYQSKSNATINQILTDKGQQSSQASSVRHYSQMSHNYSYYDQPRQAISTYSPQSKIDKNSSLDKERVDLQKLISSNKLSTYVRNGNQSRIFQKFLEQATSTQIQTIINIFYDQFHELVVDDYANYTTQKLFQKCSHQQRLKILQKLFPHIPNLVKNKQGTHTIQAFVTIFNSYEQIKLIVESIKQQFMQLCFNPISTHFVQKIIYEFPIQYTKQFFFLVNKNFQAYATDKNAMCVLKYMLRTLNEQEKKVQNKLLITQIKKCFINSITLNTPKIIQDCYGNYVIQFCFQLFGQAKSSGITEMIIQKFVQFSLQKYSSSVILKCINNYWTDKSYVLKLKDSLYPQGILQMYRNKDGNKILLDLMENNQNSALKNKIVLIVQHQVTKFFYDRWSYQIGSKSGPVGVDVQIKNFGDAQQRTYNNKQSKRPKKK